MPTPDARSQKPLHGMDYGMPPRYMLMANPALIELWGEAKCFALGFSQLPRHESLIDLPCVAIGFEDVEKGIRIFRLLKSWDCEPGSGRGTDISFVENAEAKSYTIVLGPNYSEMTRRLLDPSMQEDYSLIITGFSVGKTFTVSENFRWLQEQAKNRPIVFAPGDTAQQIYLEHEFTKADVKFFDKDTMSKDTIEYVVSSEESERVDAKFPRPIEVDSAQIAAKRTRQLKKFFAVNMARLEHNPTFVKVAGQLNHKYDHWQLTQAGCNILCGEWFPNLRTADGKVDFDEAYDALRHKPESVTDRASLQKHFIAQAIETQIAYDLEYLCDQVGPDIKDGDPVPTLQQLGLIR